MGEQIPADRLKEEADFLGVHWTHEEGDKWDVEVYPDRPDMLSVEGLARAYRGFFDIRPGLDRYNVSGGSVELQVDSSVETVRPHIGGAVVRGLDLNERMINGIIQLQEKLHVSFGRKRDRLAIGLHDLSAVNPPFTYKAVEPEQVSFTPLEYDREMELGEIMEEHEKGKKYSWILEEEDRYPIIVDSDGKVLSFPPIINNQLTEVHQGTDDIFVDVTGKHRETVLKALNIVVTALEERGGDIETVRVDGEEMPDLEPREMELDLEYVENVSGVDFEPDKAKELLEKMKMEGEERNGKLEVKVPAYRTDIMHSYDLVEDIVIAHDYRNVEPSIPDVDQVADPDEVEEFTDTLREIMLNSGALEANTHALSSQEKLFGRMEVEKEDIPEMENPLTEEYSVVRNWLIPSLLDVLKENKHNSYPQKFFEAAEVSVLDDSPVGSMNQKKLAYVVSDGRVDFTDARKILQVLGRDLGVTFEVESYGKGCFREDRSGRILLENKEIGIIGEFSDQVVENWELENPVAGFEINVEKLMGILRD